MSVVGAHSVGREWAGLILAIFWARDDPGDPLGRRIPPVLSHLGSVGTARLLGWSLGRALGDHLQSYLPGSTSLICRATLCLSCVAPARRTACPERGGLPRPDRGCPVTPAGVMEWCAGATIITAREGTSVDTLSRSVAGPAWAVLSLYQGAL